MSLRWLTGRKVTNNAGNQQGFLYRPAYNLCQLRLPQLLIDLYNLSWFRRFVLVGHVVLLLVIFFVRFKQNQIRTLLSNTFKSAQDTVRYQ